MGDCIFCDLIHRKVPVTVLFEDERVFSFLDTAPANPGHLLVIPKQHVTALGDLDEELAGSLFRVAVQLVKALGSSGLSFEGMNVHLADGEVAGQDVPHVHLHVIPRCESDDVRLDFPCRERPSRVELDALAKLILGR